MIKLRHTIILTVIIPILLSQIAFAQEDILLPKIPVYTTATDLHFSPNSIFENVSQDEAFLQIQTELVEQYRGAPKKWRRAGSLLGSFLMGYLLANDDNKVAGGFTMMYIIGGSLLAGFEVDLFQNERKSINQVHRLTIIDGSGLVFNNDITVSKPGANFDGTACGIAFLGTYYLVGPLFGYLAVFDKNNYLLYGKDTEIDQVLSRDPSQIINQLNKIPNIQFYNELFKKVSRVNQRDDLVTLNTEYEREILKLSSPIKGEFESSLQYQERLKKEELTRRSIESEYQQKVVQLKEEYETKRIRLRREIEKLANEIQFEKSYNFSISRYDADRQIFSFTIPALNETKEIVVPIAKAPQFKKRSGSLIVKQIVKPSLDGRWIPVYDDVVLADASTGNIIPWEGEVPTYATAPVSNPPSLSASVDLSEPSGEGYLDAEELATLKVTLTNSGSGPAKTTRISISQDSGPTLYYDVSASVNSIAPGNSHTERFQITVPENVTDGEVAYTISFLEAQGFEPQPLQFTAEVRAQREPLLTLVDFGVVALSGDGKVSKGKPAEITARIQNRGQGKAKGVSVKVLEDPTKNIFLAPYSEKEFRLGDIPAGESRDVIFTVLTNNRVADLVNVELKLTEKRPRFSKSGYVSLEIDKQQSQLQPLAFTGSASDVAIADLATLSVDIEQDIPKSKTKNPNALAVVFGVEDYKNVSAVTFARRDASYIKEYFHKTLGIPADMIYYKTDDDVTKGEFDKVFSKDGWLDKRIKKEGKTNVFIYYAGHGAPEIKENKAYLIPYDGDPNYASQTGYALDVLYANLENLKARSVTVFLDACFTGANRESEILLAGARPMFMEVNPSAAGNITIFSAASGKEISSAWPEKRHGLFSYFLMKGMRGDGDANNDGQLTMDELGSYIQSNVSRQAGFLDREQTPQLQTLEKGKVLISY